MFLPNYAPGMRTDRTLDHYKELTARWTAAREQVATLRTKLDEAVVTEQVLASEVAAFEVVIGKALANYREPDVLDEMFGTTDAKDEPEPESSPRVEAPDGVRPSFYELMAHIPLDGDVGTQG